MKIFFYLIALTVVTLSGCKKDLLSVSNSSLRSLVFGQDTLTMEVGDIRQLNFQTAPSGTDTTSLKWHSSDTSVVSVTNSGKLTALKIGISRVSASNTLNTVLIGSIVTVLPVGAGLKLGLIAYYPFNNSAADSSGHGNNGVAHNIVSAKNRFGTANSAYCFDGTSSYVTVPDKPELRLNSTNFSINYWVILDEYISNSGSAILAKNNGAYQHGWNTSITGLGNTNGNPSNGIAGHAFYNVSGGDDPYAIGKKVIGINNWSMVTVLYDLQKKQVSFYINGELDTTTPNIPTPNPTTNVDLFIGRIVLLILQATRRPIILKGNLMISGYTIACLVAAKFKSYTKCHIDSNTIII